MSAFEVSSGGFIEDWHLTFSAPWKNLKKMVGLEKDVGLRSLVICCI